MSGPVPDVPGAGFRNCFRHVAARKPVPAAYQLATELYVADPAAEAGLARVGEDARVVRS
jgi:hypothetical protein